MNSVQLVGRLTKNPDVRYTNGGLTIARFSVAVDRRFKSEGKPTADFPSVVAFGKTAEFIEKYFTRGMRIGIVGRIQTDSYKKDDGSTVYTTDVIAENVEFVESKQEEKTIAPAVDFMAVPDESAEDLPFK